MKITNKQKDEWIRWSTGTGDFGCEQSPETDDEGTGGHMPKKRKG